MANEVDGMQDEEDMENDDFNLVKVTFFKEKTIDRKQLSGLIS